MSSRFTGKLSQRTLFGPSLFLVLFGFVAYSNTFDVPFVFDDDIRIKDNESIRQLWPLSVPMTESNRPFGMVTFAVNYALHGYQVSGYHATNLAIHILAGLTLFGIVRRTLSRGDLAERYQPSATPLAFAAALLWLVHPLNTQAVTYIVQRLESMMGLCYLLTLYCFIRAQDSTRRALWWHFASIVACALGMGVKEVMVTAPVMVLWYHRVFVAKTWQALFRGPARYYYPALFATWGILAWAMLRSLEEYQSGNIGTVRDLTPLSYLLSQAGVITQYLKLSVWPYGQCLDYGWPVARTVKEIVPPLLFMGTLFVATVWAIFRHPAWGFLGVWFFVVLSPSSSIVPISDLAFEQRMYLPLIAVITVFVFAAKEILSNFADRFHVPHQRLRWITSGIITLFALKMGILTWARNEVYQSKAGIWQDTIEKAPNNLRCYYNLAVITQEAGDLDRAIELYRHIIRVKPDDADPYNNLGNVFMAQNNTESAIREYRRALHYKPDFAEAHNNLGSALLSEDRPDLAADEFRQAIRAKSGYAEAHCNLGNALQAQGKLDDAIEQYHEAIRLHPGFAEGYNNLGNALRSKGKHELAIEQYKNAIRLKPDYSEAYLNLANILQSQGRFGLAMEAYHQAIRFKPNDAEAYHYLGNALQAEGKNALAIEQYDLAIAIKPGFAEAYHNRSIAYHQLRNYDKAWLDVMAARKLGLEPTPSYLKALINSSGRSE